MVSDTILIPIALNPFHTSFQATNDCLCAWNFYFAPSYFALDIFLSFSSRDNIRHPPWCSLPDTRPCRGQFFRRYPLSFFIRTMEISKKGWRLDHGDLKQRNEDINKRDQLLQKGSQDREDSLGCLLPAPSPVLHRLNLGTRFLVVEENCDARIIRLQ